MEKEIKKAIIPVAGFGTRFLPVTKVQPKEMLPLVDKPIVHYLVEEAVASGIEQILFIINSSKHVIGDYFTRNLDLENFLKQRGKKDILEDIKHIHTQAEFIYVHQDEPLGSGDAVARGASFIGNEPFALFYADDVMDYPKNKPALGQLIKSYNKHGGSVMGLVRVPRKEVYKYGVVKGKKAKDRLFSVEDVVEKPDVKDAPSNLASIGRFVLTPEVFEHISKTKKIKGEIYLASALAKLAHEGKMYGYELEGAWHDCGSKFGYWKANLEMGLQNSQIKKEANKYMRDYLKNNK